MEFLIHPDGFDTDIQGASEKLPYEIKWDDFYPEEALQNVGYAFKLIDKYSSGYGS